MHSCPPMMKFLPLLLLLACNETSSDGGDPEKGPGDAAPDANPSPTVDAWTPPSGDGAAPHPDGGPRSDAADLPGADASDPDAAGGPDPEAGPGDPDGEVPEPDAAAPEPDVGPAREALGSLVVLGDSIGDGGGPSPRYYQLLERNDDRRYPEWRGLDLATRFPDARVVRRADSGSTTDALLGQVRGLPRDLPGPVAVVITSGGNDVKDALVEAATGLDAAHIARMQGNIGAALDALVDRFDDRGLVVYLANVYDSSDGQGNFGLHCRFARRLGAIEIPTDPIFERWNAAHAAETARTGQVLVDLHGRFYGHGYNSDVNWYADDCTHPNRLGHHELRALFWAHLVGE